MSGNEYELPSEWTDTNHLMTPSHPVRSSCHAACQSLIYPVPTYSTCTPQACCFLVVSENNTQLVTPIKAVCCCQPTSLMESILPRTRVFRYGKDMEDSRPGKASWRQWEDMMWLSWPWVTCPMDFWKVFNGVSNGFIKSHYPGSLSNPE